MCLSIVNAKAKKTRRKHLNIKHKETNITYKQLKETHKQQNINTLFPAHEPARMV